MVDRRIGRCLLGRHVCGRSDGYTDGSTTLAHRIGRRVASSGGSKSFGDAEIGHHRVTARQQYVVRFQVAVYDALIVCVRKRIRDLAQKPHRLRDTNARLTPKTLPQRLSVDEWHRVPEPTVALARVEDRHDVRMLQVRGERDLATESNRAVDAEVWPERLECNCSTVSQVSRPVHDGHSAASRFTFECVSARDRGLQPLDVLSLIIGAEQKRWLRHRLRPGVGSSLNEIQ